MYCYGELLVRSGAVRRVSKSEDYKMEVNNDDGDRRLSPLEASTGF